MKKGVLHLENNDRRDNLIKYTLNQTFKGKQIFNYNIYYRKFPMFYQSSSKSVSKQSRSWFYTWLNSLKCVNYILGKSTLPCLHIDQSLKMNQITVKLTVKFNYGSFLMLNENTHCQHLIFLSQLMWMMVQK